MSLLCFFNINLYYEKKLLKYNFQFDNIKKKLTSFYVLGCEITDKWYVLDNFLENGIISCKNV